MSDIDISDLESDSDDSITPPPQPDLLIMNSSTSQLVPHSKFTHVLSRLFSKHSLDIHQLDLPFNDPESYRTRFMTLANYRTLCHSFRPRLMAEPRNGEVSRLTVSQLNRFLSYHDTHWKSANDTDPPDVDDPEFVQIFCRSEPASVHQSWNYELCLSWSAFHQMIVDLAKHSPRRVWQLLFSQRFDGWLNWTSDQFTNQEVALASRGLCIICEEPVGNLITRTSLQCESCAISHLGDPYFNRDPDSDPLFDCSSLSATLV